MMHGFGIFGGYSWIWVILNFVIIAAVIIGIVWFIIWVIRRTGSDGPSSLSAGMAMQSPKEILQSRYARGEITREQYLQILDDLG